MSRTAAFAMSGALWVGALLVSDPQMIYYPMPNLVSLAVAYVLIGTAVLAWLSEKFVAALLGLWVMAMVFVAVLMIEPREDWTLFLAGSFFGTIAFLMWCAVAFFILMASKCLRSHFGRG